MDENVLLGEARADSEGVLQSFFEIEGPLSLDEVGQELAILDVVSD